MIIIYMFVLEIKNTVASLTELSTIQNALIKIDTREIHSLVSFWKWNTRSHTNCWASIQFNGTSRHTKMETTITKYQNFCCNEKKKDYEKNFSVCKEKVYKEIAMMFIKITNTVNIDSYDKFLKCVK